MKASGVFYFPDIFLSDWFLKTKWVCLQHSTSLSTSAHIAVRSIIDVTISQPKLSKSRVLIYSGKSRYFWKISMSFVQLLWQCSCYFSLRLYNSSKKNCYFFDTGLKEIYRVLCKIMAGIKQVRNKRLLPDLSKEGELTKDIVLATKEKHGVPAGIRLFSHHTLASVRRLSFYHPLFLPEDSLDLVLAATYDHSTERFADKEDLYLQPETIGCDTWRRLRNTFDKLPPVVVPLGHPMKRGGIKERKSPFSVKLMNSGVHSSQTNPGYSRQPAGGAIFFY